MVADITLLKKIRGKSDTGQICYNVNFIPAYYHADKLHTVKKNPVFDGIVMISPHWQKTWGRKADFFSVFSGLTLRPNIA